MIGRKVIGHISHFVFVRKLLCKTMRYWLLGLLLILGVNAHAAQHETILAGRRVVYWSPDKPGFTKAPIILFSHGFTGCAEQSTFLTTALAAHGYYVFAPDHRDASCKMFGDNGAKPTIDFNTPEAWQASTYADRRDDMQAVLAAIKKDASFKSKIDFTQLGLVGHSLGGYTVLGLAGAWPAWQMPGVKAVLALSPYATPYLAAKTLPKVQVPVMVQGGTRDHWITPYVTRQNGIYDMLPAPKYFVEFEGAGHFGWTDLEGAQHDLMNAYAMAFLDRYVRGMVEDPLLTEPLKGISNLRYDNKQGAQNIMLPQTTVQGQTGR